MALKTRARYRRRRAFALLLIALAAAVLIGFTVRAHAHSAKNRTAAARSVAAPTTRALSNAKVWRGDRASLRFRVTYAPAAKVTATIVVRNASGATVQSIALGSVRANRVVTARFVVNLPAGTYSCRLVASVGTAAGTAASRAGASPGSATPATLVVSQAFPGPAAIATATSWLRARSGVTAFAVVDSRGVLHGYNAGEQFVTASVVKAMLLVAYLRTYPTLSDSASEELTEMIEVSDNDDAFEMYRILGSEGMYAVARAAGMTDFSVVNDWTYAEITAADQARFFYEMDRLIPARYDSFARHLLSHVAAYESWGIPAVARPAGWTVFFKGGWRGTVRGQLVHQVARLERHGQTISIAVMTDGDPDMDYGIATVQGVTARLLGTTP